MSENSTYQSRVDELIKTAEGYYYAGEYLRASYLYDQILAIDPRNERARAYQIKTNDALIRCGDLIPAEARIIFNNAQSAFAGHAPEIAIGFLKEAIELATEAGVPFPAAEELLSDIINQLERSKKKMIFVSYAKDDYETASDIYYFLKENEFTPWMDRFDLLPGQDWELQILQSIKNCDFFIACLSQNSVSKRGYVQKELKQALSMLEQFPEGEVYLIPIRIDDCVVPESLSSRQWLAWSSTDAKSRLLRVLTTQ